MKIKEKQLAYAFFNSCTVNFKYKDEDEVRTLYTVNELRYNDEDEILIGGCTLCLINVCKSLPLCMHHVESMRLFAKLFGLIFMKFKLLPDVKHYFYKTCLDEHRV